jgi:hypothetical protein
MPAAPRRFPSPWTVVEHTESFAVHDSEDQTLAYVYFEEEDGRRHAVKRLTQDEALVRSTGPDITN